jgi:hypothetical protein
LRAKHGDEWAAAAEVFESFKQTQPAWWQYVTTYWLKECERWAQFYRKVRSLQLPALPIALTIPTQDPHYEIDTNNFLEAWHRVLKGHYLGNIRSMPADTLIYALTQQVSDT